MNTSTKLNQGRLEKILNKLYRDIDGETRSFKQICDSKLKNGYKLTSDDIIDLAGDKKRCERMRQIKSKYVISDNEFTQGKRGSNENLPEVKEYWRLFKEVPTKTIYGLVTDTSNWFDIPKLVFDYYRSF